MKDLRDLEIKFLELLSEYGWISQRSLFSIKHLPNGRIISNRSDLFGAWDIISMKNNRVVLFQVCSGTKYDAHIRKIVDKLKFPLTKNPEQVVVYYYKEKNRWKFNLTLRTPAGWIPKTPDELLK